MEGLLVGGGLTHLPSPHPLRDFNILRLPPNSKFLRTFHGGGMVIFWNNTIIFLTWGCSNIDGTASHSAREEGKGQWKENKH